MGMLTGHDIVAFRNRRGLSVDAFAATLGVSVDTVNSLEKRDSFSEEEEKTLLIVGVIPVEETPTPVSLPAPTRKFSNSEIQTFKRCRRKWWLAWYRNLAPKQITPIGVMASGSRIHKALESVYAPGGPYHDRAMDSLNKAIEADRDFMLTYLPDDEDVHKSFENSADLERIMLSGYLDWLEETGADSELEVISSEQYIEEPLERFNNTVLIGKLDVLVRRIPDDRILFMDHKTVGTLIHPTLKLNEQLLHYMTLLQDGMEVSGGLYNMLKRSKRTERAKPPFYAREEVLHNQHTLDSFWYRLMGVIDEILSVERMLDEVATDMEVKQLTYPTPSVNCHWDCPFFKICGMMDDGSRIEDAINDQYEVVDPLSYYEQKAQTNDD